MLNFIGFPSVDRSVPPGLAPPMLRIARRSARPMVAFARLPWPSAPSFMFITSPPYANNYHYNRNTRPQLFWLDFCQSTDELRELERQNFGTYWQRARELENVPLDSSIHLPDIHRTLDEIRKQNPDRGIYGGTGWANYLATYLNDCVRFVEGMSWCLKSGATGLVVIGNSIIQGVPVPTDRFLAAIAEEQGMTVVRIHSPRATRVGNSIINSSVRAGKGRSASLYESVVELRRR